jgi:hypothetical protein
MSASGEVVKLSTIVRRVWQADPQKEAAVADANDGSPSSMTSGYAVEIAKGLAAIARIERR